MFSINRIFFAGAVISAAAAVFMASGCGVAGGMHRAADVRVATTLEAGSAPKLIVSGPARLLHVDIHGRQPLNLYTVKRGADGKLSCADRARSPLPALRQGASNALNIVVPENEAVCLVNDAIEAAPRDTDISWHARRGADAPAETSHDLRAANL